MQKNIICKVIHPMNINVSMLMLLKLQDDEEILSYVKMSESLASLRTKNEKLESDMKEMEEKYNQLNQIYTEVVAENTKTLIKRFLISLSQSSFLYFCIIFLFIAESILSK